MEFNILENKAFLMILIDDQMWHPLDHNPMSKLIEEYDKMKSIYRHKQLNTSQLLMITNSYGNEDDILEQARCM